MVTRTTSGKYFILESFQEYLKLGEMEARINRSDFEDYAFTIPIELNEILERINTMALKTLTGDEEVEFRANIEACRYKCEEIQENLNTAHEVIGESLLHEVQDFISENDVTNLSRITQLKIVKGFKKQITDLEKVNASSKAAHHIQSVKNLIEKNENISFDLTTGSSSSLSTSCTHSTSSFSEASSSPSSSSNSFTSSFSQTSSSPSYSSNSFTSNISLTSSSPSYFSNSFTSSFSQASSSPSSTSENSSFPSSLSRKIPSDSEESSDEDDTYLEEHYRNISEALDSPLNAFLKSLSAKTS